MPESTRDEIAKLQEEYSRNPEGRLFVHLAEAYRRAGELERARDILLQGLQNHPDYPSARIVLAQVQTDLGQPAEARTVWRSVLDLDADNEVALRSIAELEYNAGNTADALRYYRRLGDLDQNDQEVKDLVAVLEQETNGPRPQEAAARAAEPEPRRTPRAMPEPRRPDRPEASLPAVGGGAAIPAQTDAIGLTDLLVRLLAYRDSTFHAESSLTRVLALAIGRELELDQAHLDALALAALLSDLAGLSLNEQDSAAPAEELTEEQRRRSEQREVAISLQLLQGLTLPAGVHEAIQHQHERWDGTGFPDGLREEQIPYGARVLAVARAAANMLTNSTGQARSVNAAIDTQQRNAGSQYDPVIVSVLRRVFQRRSEHGLGFGLGGRVTIIHPEELRALGVATQLHNSGYVAETAPDASRLRDRVRTAPPRALVVGAKLPGTDVERVIRDVRATASVAGIPVIVIDANQIDLRVDLLTAGADVCFPSEVGFKEFKATLDALLRRMEDRVGPGEGSRGETFA